MITLYLRYRGENYRISRSKINGKYKGVLRAMVQVDNGLSFKNKQWIACDEEHDNDATIMRQLEKAYKKCEYVLKEINGSL